MRTLLVYSSAYFVLCLCTGADLEKTTCLPAVGWQPEAVFELVSLATGKSQFSQLNI